MSFARNVSNKYGKELLDTGIDALKTVSKGVVHKAAETTGEFIENKIADKTVKEKPVIHDVGEIIIPPEKREEIFNELRQVL